MGEVLLGLKVLSVEDENLKNVMTALNMARARIDSIDREEGTRVTVGATVGTVEAIGDSIVPMLALWKSGIVVSLRRASIEIHQGRELPSGTVEVISKQGRGTRLHEPSVGELNSTIKALMGEKSDEDG